MKTRHIIHIVLAGLIFFGILLDFTVFAAEAGRITGKVTDSESGEPLPGANVSIKGTALGTATNLEGEYTVNRVPPGRYTLVFSYIGYTKQEIIVNVMPNTTVTQDASLSYEVIKGQEVVVTAQMYGQAAAINQQITSPTAINVVSAERIRELPDANAAESIGRLPGISLIRSSGEANKVVVRGLEPKFNTITINGVKIPSTSSDDRSVDLSMIGSGMLEGIEVFKAVTPNMDADAVGGTVNLKIKKAPTERSYWLKVDPGYSDLKADWHNIKSVGEFGQRFFNQHLGLVITGNYERINRSSENYGASYVVAGLADTLTGKVPIDGTNLNIRTTDETRNRWGGSAVLDYSLKNGNIWLTNFFNSTFRDPYSMQKSYSSPNISYNVNSQEITTSGLSNSFNGELILVGMNMDWVLSRYKVEDQRDYNLATSFLQGSAFDKTLNPKLIETYVPASRDNVGEILLQSVSFSPSTTTQTEYAAQYNISIPMTLGDWVAGSIKSGFKYTNSKKNYVVSSVSETHFGLAVEYTNGAQQYVPYPLLLNSNSIITAENFVQDSADYENIINDEYKFNPIFDQAMLEQFSSYIKPYLPYSNQTLANRYALQERVTAGYIMGELKIGQFLTAIPGVRYEHSNNWYQAYKADTYSDFSTEPTAAYDTTSTRKNEYWFPHLHLKIKPAGWFQIMMSANRSIARPNYSWISPWVSLNVGNATISRGNPDLLDTKVWNYNLTLNVFDNTFGLFAVSGFYKDLHDISYRKTSQLLDPEEIEYLQIPFKEKGYTQTTYVNSKKAKVYGYEIELQTKLLFVPGIPNFMRGIVINANYSRIWSETYFPFYSFEAKAIPNTRPVKFKYDLTEWERKGPMPGQADAIANISAGYDIGGLSTRLSYLYQGPSISSVSLSSLSDSWNNSFSRWDLAVKYRFNEMVSVNFNLVNINNQTDRTFYGSDQYMTSEYFYGMTGSAGIELNF